MRSAAVAWCGGLALGLCLAAPVRAQELEASARGLRLLQMQGCLACHSLDGSPSAGPSFQGRFGGTVRVLEPGGPRELRFDRAYLERSLREPDAAIAAGFPRGVMPSFALNAEQVDAIAAGLDRLAQAQPDERPNRLELLGFGGGSVLLAIAVGALLSRRRRARRAGPG